jgi:hypothetical protein
MSISININFDVDDLIWELGSHDKKELLEALLEDMDDEDIRHILSKTQSSLMLSSDDRGCSHDEFQKSLQAISDNYMQVTSEEENTIKSLAKRFI